MTPTPAPSSPGEGIIILFDGVCNLCDGTVRWIIRHDPNAVFRFASLQSDAAKRLISSPPGELGTPPASMLVIVNGTVLAKSDAWLAIVKRLSPRWNWLAAFGILPKGLRDAVYDFIARNRYKWFGKKDNCPLPDPRLKDRFLN